MQKNKKLNYKQIAVTLENAISRPPAKAGLRLFPEHKLAYQFGVSRMKIRMALDLLFDKGYLSRSRGCGTFLRKTITNEDSFHSNTKDMPSIFDLRENSESGRIADVSQQKLRLSFWHDFDFFDTNRIILEGMKKSAVDKGHSFSPISIMKEKGKALSVETLREIMHKKKYDGYLVSARYAKLFKEALDGMEVNCAFVIPGLHRIEYEPLIQINLFEAAGRAVRKLHESGFRRIAMISLDRKSYNSHIYDETVAYNFVIEELGLKYSMNSRASLDIKSISKEISNLFDNVDNRPDAIYVADEHFVPAFIHEMKKRNIDIGKDIGVITHISTPCKTKSEINFSCMEFDLMEFGAIVIDAVIQSTMTAGKKISNLSLNASWCPGTTHFKN